MQTQTTGDTWPLAQTAVSGSGQKARSASNRLRVLGLIARKAELSQRRVARRLGLKACTVSNIVRELKNMGCVRDAGEIEADRVGPKERELELVPQFGWSLGLGVTSREYCAVAVGISGEILHRRSFDLSLSMEQLADALCAYLDELVLDYGLDRERFAGLGISVPGVVQTASGTVLVSEYLGLNNYPMKAIFEKRLGCPVCVNRDVNCGSYAEHYTGATGERMSFIYFMSTRHPCGGISLGVAVVIDEKVFPGNHWGAGEVRLPALDAACKSAAAGAAVDEDALFETEYKHYVEVIALIVNLLDISCLVLGVDDPRLSEPRLEALRADIVSRLVSIPGRNFEMLHTSPGAQRLGCGAALMAMHNRIAASLHTGNLSADSLCAL